MRKMQAADQLIGRERRPASSSSGEKKLLDLRSVKIRARPASSTSILEGSWLQSSVHLRGVSPQVPTLIEEKKLSKLECQSYSSKCRRIKLIHSERERISGQDLKTSIRERSTFVAATVRSGKRFASTGNMGSVTKGEKLKVKEEIVLQSTLDDSRSQRPEPELEPETGRESRGTCGPRASLGSLSGSAKISIKRQEEVKEGSLGEENEETPDLEGVEKDQDTLIRDTCAMAREKSSAEDTQSQEAQSSGKLSGSVSPAGSSADEEVSGRPLEQFTMLEFVSRGHTKTGHERLRGSEALRLALGGSEYNLTQLLDKFEGDESAEAAAAAAAWKSFSKSLLSIGLAFGHDLEASSEEEEEANLDSKPVAASFDSACPPSPATDQMNGGEGQCKQEKQTISGPNSDRCGEKKSTTSKRRPKLGYWPLISSSSSGGATFSCSFGTSAQIVDERQAQLNSKSFIDHPAKKMKTTSISISKPHEGSFLGRVQNFIKSRSETHSNCGGLSGSENFSLTKIRCLIEQNLVATLIGAYILISLAVILFLMLPYLFGDDNLKNNSGEISREQEMSYLRVEQLKRLATKSDEKAQGESYMIDVEPKSTSKKESSTEEILGDRGQQTNDDNNSTTVADSKQKTVKSISVQTVESSLSQTAKVQDQPLQELKRILMARLRETEEARTKESEEFKELWRIAHKRPCQAMSIGLCGRTIESMMPQAIFSSKSSHKASVGLGHRSAAAAATTTGEISYNYQLYDRTLLPNQFTIARQSQVEQVLNKFEPLVDVRCYALMPMFLCSIFAPKCIQFQLNSTRAQNPSQKGADSTGDTASELTLVSGDHLDRLSTGLAAGNKTSPSGRPQTRPTVWSKLVPPCRSVCIEAIRKCSFFLEVLNLKLISLDDCVSLPESDDPAICVGQREHLAYKRRAELTKRCNKDEEFRCQDGACIPKKWRCDGWADCKDRSDEEKCSRCNAATQFYCGQDLCIDKRQVCNGRVDCKDGRDERLCLRLSNSTRLGASLAQLETWNSSVASWLPVCGLNWRPEPMSQEACQALGYSSANETLISFGPASAQRNAKTRSLKAGRRFEGGLRLATQMKLDDYGAGSDSTSAIAELPEVASGPTGIMDSLSDLLYHDAQIDCDPSQAVRSSVFLSCHDFQCGRSITSHLARVSSSQQQSTAISQTVDLGLARSTPAARSWPTLASDEAGEESGEQDEAEMEYRRDVLESRRTLDRVAVANSLGEKKSSETPVSSRLVVGGLESMPGEFPYLAALHGGPDEVFFCGGVLISPNWLLTAAHCVGNRTQPEGWMVKVGVTRRIASPAFVRKLRVRKIIKHPEFERSVPLNNDIALILLAEKVDFNPYLRPICLPEPNLRLEPDSSKDCVVVGFGKSRFAQEANYLHVAHFVNVPIISKPVCAAWYSEQDVTLTDGMLCAGYSEGKRDACQGDSGSGLFCRYPNTNQFYVAGLVSFGIKCATPKLPGVYASVPLYVDWIRETTRELEHPII